MKIVHVPYGFYPDPVGGTEVYVASLASQMLERGVEVSIAAPGDREQTYTHSGLPVLRFPVSGPTDVRDLYGEGDPLAAAAFGRILDAESPDLVHLHALTRGVSLRLVREVKRRHIPVVFTYHTPTVSCQRGTLMHWGREVCDGAFDLSRCTACTLQGHGLPQPLARLVGRAPVALGKVVGRTRRAGPAWTALRMRELVGARHESFRAMVAEVDHVVAVCQWAKVLLLRNGVPAEKVTVSRHGLSRPMESVHREPRVATAERPLRMAFLGRWDRAKGPDLLVRALQALPGAPVQLDLYGITQGGADAAYLQQLEGMAGQDARIRFLPPVANDKVISLLRSYHLLAVPSQWLETGPLVVLEAFTAGIPVLGSDLGGIAELVRHEINGLLVTPHAVHEWARAIQRLIQEPGLLDRLGSGIEPPRQMGDVADEMLRLYQSLVPCERPMAAAAAA